MIINKVFYVILLIISAFFYVLYSKPLSFYIFIFIASLPFFLGICILSAKFLVTANLEAQSDTVSKNNKINFRLKIKNRTVFPFSNCIATIYYYNNLNDAYEYMTVSVPVHSICCSEIGFSFVSERCGMIHAHIESVQIYDFIRLFSVKIKPKNECNVIVLPESYDVSDKTLLNTVLSDESDIFSKHKSGDDPSEIFSLKDYESGDKPNRIHWNLSIKHDNLIVKHYSMPVSTSILIVLDFCGCPCLERLKTFDTAAEAAFSAACVMAENKVPFSFAYFSKDSDSMKTVTISDFLSLSIVFGEIFRQELCEKTYFADDLKKNEHKYSKIIFISTSSENVEDITKINCPDKISLHFVKDEKCSETFSFENSNDDVHVIYAQKPETGISEILI